MMAHAFMDYWIIAGFKQREFYIICNKFKIIIEFVLINFIMKIHLIVSFSDDILQSGRGMHQLGCSLSDI